MNPTLYRFSSFDWLKIAPSLSVWVNVEGNFDFFGSSVIHDRRVSSYKIIMCMCPIKRNFDVLIRIIYMGRETRAYWDNLSSAGSSNSSNPSWFPIVSLTTVRTSLVFDAQDWIRSLQSFWLSFKGKIKNIRSRNNRKWGKQVRKSYMCKLECIPKVKTTCENCGDSDTSCTP